MLRRLAVRLFWNRSFAGGGARTWLHEEVVRLRVNRRVTGREDVWPLEWFAESHPGRRRRALSLGCGEGALERDLFSKGLAERVLGLDISDRALRAARAEAARQGLEGVEYALADLDRLELEEETFDGVFAHQALHHVRALEHCLDQVAKALEPRGVFYLDEYVGPSRREWRRSRLAEADRVFQELPRRARRRRRLKLPVDWRDPSEAVRSSEIPQLVGERFRIEERRGYGGNLLSVIYPHLDLASLGEEERRALLAELLDREDEMLQGEATSFYEVLIARKRS
jgi:SAM-dependent methyltransferase